MILNEDIFDKKENLKEDFSDSMPRWVRAGLRAEIGRVGTPYSSKSRYKNYDKSTLAKYPEVADYAKRKYTGRDDSSYSDNIFSKLRSKGIDLTKAKFITGPIPKKGSDPRLKEPNIPFLLLSYDGQKQLFVKGINDTMDSIVPRSKDGQYLRLRYIPMPDILDNTIEFAYINGDDPENHAEDIQGQRSIAKSELPPNYYRNTNAKKGDKPTSWQSSYYDASGYIVNPDRYLSRLRDFMKGNAAKHVKKAYDRILNIQETLSNAIKDIDDPLDVNLMHNISGIVRDYRYEYMMSYYKAMINNLKLADAETDENSKNMYLDRIFKRGGKLDDFNATATKVENLLSQYSKFVVDWDNPE